MAQRASICRMLVADTGREVPQEGIDFYRAAGWSEDHLETYRQRFGGFGRGVSRMPDAYRRLVDGETITLAGAPWTVVTGNGHSPEHGCLYSERLNVLISGDQLLPRISSNVSVHPTEPLANPLQDWIDSCRKLKGAVAGDVLVLPAHNLPFRGAHRRLDHLVDGHETGLTRLKRRLGEAPRRAVDVFPALFSRKIGDEFTRRRSFTISTFTMSSFALSAATQGGSVIGVAGGVDRRDKVRRPLPRSDGGCGAVKPPPSSSSKA